MRKKLFAAIFLMILINTISAQEKFEVLINVESTSIKNQQRTGTCWSFATASFLESEILRIKGKSIDLSEMYNVRNIYEHKAKNYFLRQGKANFSQGGLSHDYINALATEGLIPQSIFDGRPKGEAIYNHEELFKVLEGYLKSSVSSKLHTSYWFDGFNAILDVYFGSKPIDFSYDGKNYTPIQFAEYLGLKAKNYIELTSFTHHPYQKYFVLEIPDNYSSGLYYNINIKNLKEQTDFALQKGFTVSWDGDVSEKGFKRMEGLIIMDDNKVENYNFDEIAKQRQKEFEAINTTDDHLMHIIGKVKDENGKIYYIIKNSWGNTGNYDGYYYMSERYFLNKTIAIMIHRDALKENLKPTIFIQDAMY